MTGDTLDQRCTASQWLLIDQSSLQLNLFVTEYSYKSWCWIAFNFCYNLQASAKDHQSVWQQTLLIESAKENQSSLVRPTFVDIRQSIGSGLRFLLSANQSEAAEVKLILTHRSWPRHYQRAGCSSLGRIGLESRKRQNNLIAKIVLNFLHIQWIFYTKQSSFRFELWRRSLPDRWQQRNICRKRWNRFQLTRCFVLIFRSWNKLQEAINSSALMDGVVEDGK